MITNILKIDLDSKKDWQIKSFIRAFIKLYTNIFFSNFFFELRIKDIKVMESEKGLHITIFLNKPLSWKDAVLFQCLLGSDRNRELSNFCRGLFENWDIFNFFARKKYIFGKDGSIKYISEEKYTKRCEWLEKKLKRIVIYCEEGKYKHLLGKYH